MIYTTAKEYLEMESDPIPHLTKWGLKIENVNVACTECGQQTRDIKTSFTDMDNVCVLNGVGVCDPCRLIITAKPIRIYEDNRTMFQNNDGEWVTGKYNTMPKWLWKILKFFFKDLGSDDITTKR